MYAGTFATPAMARGGYTSLKQTVPGEAAAAIWCIRSWNTRSASNELIMGIWREARMYRYNGGGKTGPIAE
ncbi:hypothetical protein DQG23_38280 [Paenibacillus contaminans]|uniref:Uncharacterized protein n=1 Tax=Paenibacillus contaminans TaxID=450362 RepID=A0A329LSB7_9BACL|nr:hypothetical protein DQG23_38280 [Paenibacillus contaminans]